MTVTKAHITRKASEDDVPAKTVERDYVLAHVVSAIAATDQAGILVFKGGTSLRLIHFEDYRYSADLDYSIVGASKADALEVIQRSLVQVRDRENSITEAHLTEADPPRVAYVGPLKSKPRTLKLDLADDELVVNTERKPLRRLWSDLEQVEVLTYTLLEVAAEKLRCVLQRLQCRDLFDLDLLLTGHHVDPANAAALFRDKATHREIDPAIFADRYRERLVAYEKRWERELSQHVPGDVPHFEQLQRQVSRALRNAGLLG